MKEGWNVDKWKKKVRINIEIENIKYFKFKVGLKLEVYREWGREVS